MFSSSTMLTTSKRILIFSLAYHPMVGGAEIAVKEITDRIPDIEFDMITMRFDKIDLPKEKIGNCTIYRISTSKNLYPFKALFLGIKLHKSKSYDAIWAIMANWAGFAALFFKLRFPQVSYVLTLQEGDPIPYIKHKVRFVYPLFKRIFLRADIIQTISNYLADWARETGYEGKLKVIPNGVNVEKFMSVGQSRASTKRAIVLITVSRLVEKNGIQDIINALKFLPKNVKLKILGVGPLESNLKSMATGLPVEFLDLVPQDEIPKYLHDADIFVRPSLSEGMGSSFIEAMAAGLPVIATPVGGILDFLKDGETGLFCKIKNPRSIAEQVERLINNSNLRQKLSENGQKLVREKYDWDLVAKRMKEEIFDPAIARQVR